MLIWTPLFGGASALAVYMGVVAVTETGGAWFGFALFALVGVLSGVTALYALLDWFSEPVETTGQVARKWRKFDLLIFFRAHYVLVARNVYRVSRAMFDEMPEEGGWVYVRHYRHTCAVVAWQPVGEDERPLTDEEREALETETAVAQRREREAQEAPAPERVDLPTFGGSNRVDDGRGD